MPIVTVEKPLKTVLGDDGADSLIRLLNQVKQDQKEDILLFVEEKFERRLSLEISKVNERLSEEISRVNDRLSSEISKVNERITSEVAELSKQMNENDNKLLVQIHKSQANLIKWMFIFWVGQIGAIMAILFAFFNK
ncbi:MAG: hypothetical protein SCK70_16840 [bacterium]|nr:hypothetical protein [bacterium]